VKSDLGTNRRICGVIYRMRSVTVSALLASALFLHAQPDDASKFSARLLQNRYGLSVRDGQLTGTGVQVLRTAIAQSRFVLLGETHGLAEVARFAGAVCKLAEPEGFHTLAIEEGPLVTTELERWARRTDAREQLARFLKRYPESVNMYNAVEEIEMLQQCGSFGFWGVNQEGLGAAGLMLERILDTHPGPESAAAIRRLLQKNETANAQARDSGRIGDLYMISADNNDLAAAAAALQKDGNPRARSLFTSFAVSHEINRAWPADPARRFRLMKSLFAADYAEATRSKAGEPKVLLKFGAFHVYRGFNPAHGSGIGNYVAEFADASGAESLHICVTAVKYTERIYPRIGQPARARAFNLKNDPNSRYLQPILANVLQSDWTLIDLRPLRQALREAPTMANSQLSSLLFGMDLLVVIPEATASTRID
jgi:hypothetical protein